MAGAAGLSAQKHPKPGVWRQEGSDHKQGLCFLEIELWAVYSKGLGDDFFFRTSLHQLARDTARLG